jgi:hypothetical protein
VTYSKGIIRTLAPFGKPADPIVFPVAGKYFPASGKDLMAISLMTDVPNQLIIRRVKDIVKGYRQLDYPQAGRKMPTVNADDIDDILAEFIANLVQLLPAQQLEIIG